MRDFTKLTVWHRSRELMIDISALLDGFPPRERFGLAVQLSRATNSIGANIAEGAGRNSRADYARFLGYALASSNEVEHHLVIAQDLGMISHDEATNTIRRVKDIRRMLQALRRRILADQN